MQVLVPADAPLDALGPLPAGVRLVPVAAGPLPPEAAAARMLVVGGGLAARLDEVLAAAPGLEVVQTVSAGVDWIVGRLPEDVTLCNASGVHDGPVAEWVVLAILAMQRRLPELLALQAEATWDPGLNGATCADASPLWPMRDLEDTRVLILGHGSIGRAVEARLRPFGALVTGVARRARPGVHTLDEAPALAGDADVVVVLLPDTPETAGIVDGAFLDEMPHGALLVNAGRGRQVVTDELVERLRAGRVRAALDVTDPEPLPGDHPLWRVPGVLITPHVAGTTERWERRAYRLAGDQVRRLAAGEPLVNVRAHGY